MRDLLTTQIPRLHDLISAELDDVLSSAAKRVQYNDGQLIYKRGDASLGFTIVRSGSVRFGNLGSDGAYLLTSIADVGHCFGEFTLFSDLPRTHDSSALGATTLDEIPAKQFLNIYDKHVELSKALLVISLSRTHEVLEFFDDMRRLPLNLRVAKFLLERSETRDIDILQQDLAFTFGVSRVAMGGALKKLELNGFIQRGYSRITIQNAKALRQWVQEQLKLTPIGPK